MGVSSRKATADRSEHLLLRRFGGRLTDPAGFKSAKYVSPSINSDGCGGDGGVGEIERSRDEEMKR